MQPAPATAPAALAATREERETPAENDAAVAAAETPVPQDHTDRDAPQAADNTEGIAADDSSVEPSDEEASTEEQVETAVGVAPVADNRAQVEPLEAGLALIPAAREATDTTASEEAAAQAEALTRIEDPASSAARASQLTAVAQHEAELSTAVPTQTEAAARLADEPTADVANKPAAASTTFADAVAAAEPTKTKEATRRSSSRELPADVEEAADIPNSESLQTDVTPVEALPPDSPDRKSAPETPPPPEHHSGMMPTGRGNEDTVSATTVPPRFAQHWLARGTERTSPADGLEIDQTRFIERVARAFQAAEGRDGVLRLRLSPPELGALRLELKMHEGALTARVEAETPTAKALLLEHLPMLRERLAEQGVRVEQFDVDLLDRRFGQTPEQSGHRQPDERDDQRPGSGPPRIDTGGEGPSSVTRATFSGDGRLNVIV